jgi:hypothetical protein
MSGYRLQTLAAARGDCRIRWRIGYDRDGSDLQSRGLYLEMAPWEASLFTLTKKA